MTITVSTATLDNYLFGANVGQKHSKHLGFIRKATYQEAAARGELFIAWKGEEVVGVILVLRLKSKALLKIDAVAVSEEHRKQGIAQALIARAKAYARVTKAVLLELSCPVGEAANEFYQHTGWQLLQVRERPVRDLNIWRSNL